jgi:hypothetical protein
VAAQRGGAVVDHRSAELQQLGVAADVAAAWLAQQEPEPDADDAAAAALGQADDPHAPLAMWPENWPALTLFLQLQTQWRFTAAGVLQGLRYGEVQVVMQLLKLKKKRRLFEQLQEMEQAALEAWDEQQH